MKKAIAVILAAALGIWFSSAALAGKDDGGSGGQAPAAQTASAPKSFDSAQTVGTKAACPVTGETFTIKEGTAHSEHNGKHVYFCCPACKPSFDRDPEKYLK